MVVCECIVQRETHEQEGKEKKRCGAETMQQGPGGRMRFVCRIREHGVGVRSNVHVDDAGRKWNVGVDDIGVGVQHEAGANLRPVQATPGASG